MLCSGELFIEKKQGSNQKKYSYPHNVSDEELLLALTKVCISVDSISQLQRYGRLNKEESSSKDKSWCGAGHHDKVVTGGKKTKFGRYIYLLMSFIHT